MEDGLLSLKWNNHKTTFLEILKSLRDKANYTDATLAVDGKFYPVHKLVLSTCSDYFNEIFERTPCKAPVIVLKDVRSQDLESLLDYMYLGEVNVNQNDLAFLLKTAECLRIKGLAVPDEEPTKQNTNFNIRKHNSFDATDSLKYFPPPKRRKEDISSSSPTRVPSSTRVSTPPASAQSNILESKSPQHVAEDIPVKLEKDNDECYSETNTENNMDNVKSDSDNRLSNFSNQSQQGSNMTWEDGENNYPNDSYGDSSNQHGEDEYEYLYTSPGQEDSNSGSNIPLSIALIQSREARRCQLCQVMLANANLLRRHVEDHHFHIRKYDCVHCGKKFKRKEHRERHERIHTGEKPFACHICSSRFTQKEHLKGHIENVHNKHREKEIYSSESFDNDREESSPPSLASPSSLANLMTSSLVPLMPSSCTSPPSILPNISYDSAGDQVPGLARVDETKEESSAGSSMTALYAPVSRSSVNSPNKHVQTITINFN